MLHLRILGEAVDTHTLPDIKHRYNPKNYSSALKTVVGVPATCYFRVILSQTIILGIQLKFLGCVTQSKLSNQQNIPAWTVSNFFDVPKQK